MTEQHESDAQAVLEALRAHQHQEGHAEITVRVQNGRVTIIEESRKWRPSKG